MEIVFERIRFPTGESRGRLDGPLIGSFGLHVLLVLLTVYLVVPRSLPPVPPDDVIPVEITPFPSVKPPELRVPEPPFGAHSLLAAPPPIVDGPVDLGGAPTSAPAGSGMVRANTLYSAKAMDDPRSAGAMAQLATLAPSERIEQICNYEAMEQIAQADRRFSPDFMVAYAMSAIRWRKSTLQAKGAAFRSGGKWYALEYECETSGEPAEVAGFAFEIGEEIPRSEWEEHYLTLADAHD